MPSISFANLNVDTLLLLGGVIVLLLNIGYGVIRARQNRLKAGWQTVLVMVVACVAVAVGIIGYTVTTRAAAAAATNRFGNFGRNGQTGQGSGTQGANGQNNAFTTGGAGQTENIDQSVNGASDPQATPAAGGGNGGGFGGGRLFSSMPPEQQTMVANGQVSDAFATLVAEGTQIPDRVLTAVASGQFPVGGRQGANAAGGGQGANPANGSNGGAPAGGSNASGSNAPSGNSVFASMPPAQQTMVANGQTGDAFATLVAEGTLQFSAGSNAAGSNPANGGNNANSGIQAPSGFSAPSGFQAPSNSNAAQVNPTGVPNGTGNNSGVQAPSGFSAPPGFQAPSNATTGTGQTDQSGTGAQGGNGTGTGNFGGNGIGTGSGTFQRGTGTQTVSVPANLVGNMLAGIGGVLIFFGGIYLYYYERRRPGFVASASRGLLNAGAGVFIVSAAVIVPTLPASISGSANAARQQVVVNTAIVTRNVATATPSPAPASTLAPTDLPTLTPTPTEGTLVLATPIHYAYAEPTASSDCQVTSTSQLNLRGDPSTSNMAIGRIPPGSIMVVTGQSADGKWLQVTYNDGVNELDGWVSAQFTSTLTGCTGTPPVIATGTSIPAPTATATAAK